MKRMLFLLKQIFWQTFKYLFGCKRKLTNNDETLLVITATYYNISGKVKRQFSSTDQLEVIKWIQDL